MKTLLKESFAGLLITFGIVLILINIPVLAYYWKKDIKTGSNADRYIGIISAPFLKGVYIFWKYLDSDIEDNNL